MISGFRYTLAGGILSAVMLLCSCRTTAPEKPHDLYRERINAIGSSRFHTEKRIKMAVFGESAELEIQKVQQALTGKGITVKVYYPDSRAILCPMLRSGCVDLIASEFTPQEIERRSLTPVLIYEIEKTKYCLAVRREDQELIALLKTAEPVKDKKDGKQPQKTDRKP